MANGQDFLNQQIVGAGQNIAAGIAQARQNKKLALVAQAKRKFDQAQAMVDIGFKALGKAKNTQAKQYIWDTMVPSVALVTGNQEFGKINLLDDPTVAGLDAMATIFEQAGLQGLKQFGPRIMASVAQQAGDTEGAQSLQQAMQGIIRSSLDVEAQSQGTGAVQEFQADGKTILGRPTPQGSIQPISGVQGRGAQNVQLPPKALSAEAAGQASSTQLGIKDLQAARNILFPSGGAESFNFLTGLTAQFKIPKTKGREAATLLDNSLQVKIRQESGAAVPDSEIRNAQKRFGINPLTDTPSQMFDKLARLEYVFNNFLFELDPQGKLKLVPKDNKTPNFPSSQAPLPKIQNLKLSPSR